MNRYYVVEQIGDCTFRLPGSYPCQATAMLAAVDLTVTSMEEREYFVDGDTMDHPKGIGPNQHDTN